MLHVLPSSLVIRNCGFGIELWIVTSDSPKCYHHVCRDITVPQSYSFIRSLKTVAYSEHKTDTENSEIHTEATKTLDRHCDVAASAQNAQECNVLRIP